MREKGYTQEKLAEEADQDLRRYAIYSGTGSDTPNLKKQTT